MINQIIEMFDNLTPILWASQISGIIGFIIILISYQFSKKKYILISAVGLFFLLLEQVLAKLVANSISLSISLIRNILMYVYLVRDNKELPKYMLTLLLVSSWVTGLIYVGISNTWLVIYNYLPIIASSIQTLTQNSKNYYVVKTGVLIGEVGFIAYYFLSGLPLSMIREMGLLLSAFISIIILLVKDIKNKKLLLD